jgi:hypothetical protein
MRCAVDAQTLPEGTKPALHEATMQVPAERATVPLANPRSHAVTPQNPS